MKGLVETGFGQYGGFLSYVLSKIYGWLVNIILIIWV